MPLPDDVQAALVDAYVAGESVSAIVTAHQIGRATLYKVLREHGVELGRGFHGRAKEWTAAELEQVRAMRLGGASKERIRVAFGTDQVRADRALRQLGLDRMPAPEPEPEPPSALDLAARGVPVDRAELLKAIKPR